MESELPDPPVPPDLDLRDFRWMPLDLHAFDNSIFVTTASAEVLGVALRLWRACWHQVPASSLPNNDKILAIIARASTKKSWSRLKLLDVLHGFQLCNDGLLYHEIIAKKALEAFELKQKRTTKARNAADARWHARSIAQAMPQAMLGDAIDQTRQEQKGIQKSAGARNFLSVDQKLWNDYLAMRQRIGLAVDDAAEHVILDQLADFRSQGFDAGEIVRRAIVGEYRDLRPPPRGRNGGGTHANGGISAAEAAARAVRTLEAHQREREEGKP